MMQALKILNSVFLKTKTYIAQPTPTPLQYHLQSHCHFLSLFQKWTIHIQIQNYHLSLLVEMHHNLWMYQQECQSICISVKEMHGKILEDCALWGRHQLQTASNEMLISFDFQYFQFCISQIGLYDGLSLHYHLTSFARFVAISVLVNPILFPEVSPLQRL